MIQYGLPILFTLALWWASTGLILWLDGLRPATFRWSMAGASALLALAVGFWLAGLEDATPAGAYLAFACGLTMWGWQLVGFYMGFVTGPRKTACNDQLRGFARFVAAVQTSLWHELTVLASAIALLWFSWGHANEMVAWTFMVLWWMHQSAKLNIYFGVPNLGEELLPDHLAYLRSFMRRRPMNLLFPFSVSISTVVTVLLSQKAGAESTTAFEATAFTILATLMALAIAEHWFLVAPIPANALWAFGIKRQTDNAKDSAPLDLADDSDYARPVAEAVRSVAKPAGDIGVGARPSLRRQPARQW